MIDSIYITLIAFLIILLAIVLIPIAWQITYQYLAHLSNVSNNYTKQELKKVEDKYNVLYDLLSYMIIAIVFSSLAMSILLAYLHASHPIFLAIGIVFILIGAFMAIFLRDALIYVVSNNPIITTFVSRNVFLEFLIKNFHYIMMASGVLIIIAQLINKHA